MFAEFVAHDAASGQRFREYHFRCPHWDCAVWCLLSDTPRQVADALQLIMEQWLWDDPNPMCGCDGRPAMNRLMDMRDALRNREYVAVEAR